MTCTLTQVLAFAVISSDLYLSISVDTFPKCKQIDSYTITRIVESCIHKLDILTFLQIYLPNRLHNAAKLHRHQSLLVVHPEEAPQNSSGHEMTRRYLKQIHFMKLHKVYQSACFQPTILKHNRNGDSPACHWTWTLINSHQLSWTLINKKATLLLFAKAWACRCGSGSVFTPRLKGSQGNIRKQVNNSTP